MSLWVIVPVKPLTEGKSRLASFLSPQTRYELNKCLLIQTISVLKQSDLLKIFIVSRCETVINISEMYGVEHLLESGKTGLNSALKQAYFVLKARATTIGVIPVDLPFLQLLDLEMMISKINKNTIIARDHYQQGTNALFHPVEIDFHYQFNEPSSAFLHAQTAIHAGCQFEYYDHPHFAFDLDEPKHYLEYITQSQVDTSCYK